MSHFGENLLPAAVSARAVAICLNSLLFERSEVECAEGLLKIAQTGYYALFYSHTEGYFFLTQPKHSYFVLILG